MNQTKKVLHRIILCLCCMTLLLPISASAEKVLIGGKDSGLINILLIGQDRREEDRARSDSILLCTLCPNTKKITVTSFLRDLYVDIPGYESNRLNAAYAIGGMDLLRQTMEENFSLYIDGCLEADFTRFPQIIDSLGGVTIELRQDEAELINKSVTGALSEGTHLLSGSQALVYSRIRSLDADGDFSRANRQRKLVASVLDRYREADLLTILNTVVDTLPMISTDLSKRQILKLTAKLFPMLNEPMISSQQIPMDGTYRFDTIRQMSVLTANNDDMIDHLRTSLMPDSQ